VGLWHLQAAAIACVPLLVLGQPAGAAARAGLDAQRPMHVQAEAYIEALSRYEAGEYEPVVAAVLATDFETARAIVVRVVEDIEADLRRPENRDLRTQDRLRAERLRRLTLTLLVHTDVLLRVTEKQRFRRQLSFCDFVLGQLRDLKQDLESRGGIDMANLTHVGAGPRMTGRREWRDVLRLIRQWYLVAVSHLQGLGNVGLVRRVIDQGLVTFQKDAELLLARGTADEMEADAGMIDRSVARSIYAPESIQHWRELTSQALGDYEDAARLQPDLHEAWLRAGRMRAHLGDEGGARIALNRVVSDAPSSMQYLAHLFLAAIAESGRDHDEAMASYKSALSLYPTAQVPLLSLSHISDASGGTEEALAWLMRSAAAVNPGRVEPWSLYRRGQAGLFTERLARLRRLGIGQ
jgi:tetratricopeptide (TPR) repeat protein